MESNIKRRTRATTETASASAPAPATHPNPNPNPNPLQATPPAPPPRVQRPPSSASAEPVNQSHLPSEPLPTKPNSPEIAADATDRSSRATWRGVFDSARTSTASFLTGSAAGSSVQTVADSSAKDAATSGHTRPATVSLSGPVGQNPASAGLAALSPRDRASVSAASPSVLMTFEPTVRAVESTTKKELDMFFSRIRLFQGEVPVGYYPADFVNDIRGVCIHGSIYLTTYRLGFYPNDPRTMLEIDSDFATVPLCMINRVEKIGARKVNHHLIYAMDIICKDFRDLRFLFSSDTNSRREAFIKISQWAFPMSSDLRFFAFDYKPELPWDIEGWKLYNPVREFTRIGLPSDSWRISTINSNYKICDTYPELLGVPSMITDEDLIAVAAFRSRGRIPALSWIHPKTKASITRCSQPRVGMSGKRSREDEKLVEAISQVNPKARVLYILDSRPRANAFGNQVKGAGFENTSNYRNISLSFMGIENIHVMRDSLTKLRQVCLNYGSKTSHLHYNQNTNGQDSNAPPSQHWYEIVNETQWLNHIKIVLIAAVRLIKHVTEGDSVMIHCSDGWDRIKRTAQQSSLAMMCMDPFYRTIEGFMILIEKEWCSFGHKFTQRIGHGDEKHTDDQRAPIFLQFIDCVWQISRQYPHVFQFNELMLAHIVDHHFSCRFGTFLCNSEKESMSYNIRATTSSLWSYLCQNKKMYFNHKFTGPLEFSPDIVDLPAIMPNPHSIAVSLWTGYYLRWTSHAPFLESHNTSEFYDHESFEYRKQMLAEARLYQMAKKQSQSELITNTEDATENEISLDNSEAEVIQSDKSVVDKDLRIHELESKLQKLQTYMKLMSIAIPSDIEERLMDENEKSAIEDSCHQTQTEENENATRVDMESGAIEIEIVPEADAEVGSPSPPAARENTVSGINGDDGDEQNQEAEPDSDGVEANHEECSAQDGHFPAGEDESSIVEQTQNEGDANQ